jgi:hypothetical protein
MRIFDDERIVQIETDTQCPHDGLEEPPCENCAYGREIAEEENAPEKESEDQGALDECYKGTS